MTITKTQDNTIFTFKIEGRLDTNTSPQLETAINEVLESSTQLNLDFTDVTYISSAGLRVLLSAQKAMNKKNGMTIFNANEAVMEVFEITGFSDILTLK